MKPLTRSRKIKDFQKKKKFNHHHSKKMLFILLLLISNMLRLGLDIEKWKVKQDDLGKRKSEKPEFVSINCLSKTREFCRKIQPLKEDFKTHLRAKQTKVIDVQSILSLFMEVRVHHSAEWPWKCNNRMRWARIYKWLIVVPTEWRSSNNLQSFYSNLCFAPWLYSLQFFLNRLRTADGFYWKSLYQKYTRRAWHCLPKDGRNEENLFSIVLVDSAQC